PFGSGTIGARAGSYTMSAISVACRFLKNKMARVMAHDLQLVADPEDFIFVDGKVIYTKSDNVRKTFREVVERIIMAPLNLPVGESGGLEHTAFFGAERPLIVS